MITNLEKSLQLDCFISRLYKLQSAHIVDSAKMDQDRTFADPETITNLLIDFGLEQTQKNRTRLHNDVQEGRRWRRICGKFEGLLCLIPPNRDRTTPGREYQELSDIDVRAFHALLGSTQLIEPLCRMGKAFQASLLDNSEVPLFEWESEARKRLPKCR